MIESFLKMNKTLGVIFIVLLLTAVWLTYAMFTKQFADYETITLRTTSTGLQLPTRADVKVRGVIVGEVLEAETDGSDGATLTLGIYPDKLDSVPHDVTGALIPKTLFGEKYVSLVIPEGSTMEPISAGATIEKTELPVEVEQVLNDLYPLLNAVAPADLNLTLTALATALQGRGDAIGNSIETVDAYLKRLNPQIPALMDDLDLTSEVADIYVAMLPELGDILDNTLVTLQTIEGREAKLRSLLRDVRAFSDTGRVFLDRNEARLKRVGELTTTQLAMISRYSGMFPCLSKALLTLQKDFGEAFRNFELHINLEPLEKQRGAYGPQDTPHFAEDRGANCLDLPNPPGSQAHPFRNIPNFDDGVERDLHRVSPAYVRDQLAADGLLGYRGGPDQNALLTQFLQQQYGAGTDALGVLLGGPLVAEGSGG